MPVREQPLGKTNALKDRFVFLSASIPDPDRWSGDYDAYEITDAVVAITKAVLAASGRVVCAAHPTIAPLLVTVANDFPRADRPHVVVYQSRLFEDRIPDEIDELAKPGVGDVVWTDAAPGESPDGERHKSLEILRQRMLDESDPAAAIFVGGMEGILDEFEMFLERYPDRPTYAFGKPGGEAREVLERIDSELKKDLAGSDVYPALMRHVIDDLAANLS